MNLKSSGRSTSPVSGLKKAAIFGSYARGEHNEDSDVDLLVDIPDEYSLLDIVGIQQELEDVLKKRVDLVEYTTLKSALKESILSQAKVIYS